MGPVSRRKLSNLVINRGALARLSVPFLLMGLVSVGVVLTMRWKVIKALQQTELVGLENLPAMNTLLELQRSATSIGAAGLVIMTALCLALWVIFSHRIFGPTIPIRRHVQKLAEGDYSSRLQLRSGDEFNDLAEDLNHLAEVLESKSEPHQATSP